MRISMKQYKYLTLFVVVAVIALLGVVFLSPSDNFLARRSATNLVVDFGMQLQRVSLLGEPSVVSAAIEEHYGPYVTEQLLQEWLRDLDEAPGRLTSSPWPARVDVIEMTRQGNGYVIRGNIVLMTSVEVDSPEDDNAGMIPVLIQVIDDGGEWKIAAYQEQIAETPQE